MLVRTCVRDTDLTLFPCCEFQRGLHPPYQWITRGARHFHFKYWPLLSCLMWILRGPFVPTDIWNPNFLLTSVEWEIWREGEDRKKFSLKSWAVIWLTETWSSCPWEAGSREGAVTGNALGSSMRGSGDKLGSLLAPVLFFFFTQLPSPPLTPTSAAFTPLYSQF